MDFSKEDLNLIASILLNELKELNKLVEKYPTLEEAREQVLDIYKEICEVI